MADRVEILMHARGGRQVEAETRQASRGFQRMDRAAGLASKTTGRLGVGMRGLGRGMLYAGGIAGGAALVAVKRGTEAWEEHRKIAADTRQAIKSTGGEANVTAKHVDRLANSIQAKTAVDDDQVAAGQNMLLTFLRVRNEQGKGNKVFDRATGLAVDMAKRFGGDVPSAFKQLGKALDDPAKGLLALRRSGVSFTKAETDKIKKLEETGHHLEAQRMILAALDKQVGGSARAQATPIAKLKESWGDLEKELGRAVAPTIDTVSDKMRGLVDSATKIMGRKDLTWDAKVRLFSKRDLEPEARKLVKGLKDADLDEKLKGAVEWAIPKMADGFLTAGPAAVKAMVKGFNEAGPGGKLLLAWFTGKKLGLGKLAMGGMFGRGGGLLSKGGTPANPMWVAVVNNAPGGKIPGWAKKAGGAAGIVKGAMKLGGKVAPWAIVGDALINADAAGLEPGRERGLLSEAFGSKQSRRLSRYPDAPGSGVRPMMPDISTALAGKVGTSIAHGVRPLDRLPQKTADAVARRPQNIRLGPINVLLPDGRIIAQVAAEHPDILADAVAGPGLKYKERG